MQRSNKHNMGYGYIPEEILDLEGCKIAFNDAFNRNETNMKYRYLNYGFPKGDKEVRNQISKFYSKFTGCNYNPDNMIVNFGCTIALTNAISATIKKGEKVMVEVPSFFSAILQLEELRLDLVPIARGNDGQFNMEELEKTVIDNDIKGFYIVTNYANPTGMNLNKQNRAKLYDLAKKHKFYVYSDDIYETLYIDEESREIPLFFSDERTAKGETSHLATFDNNSNEYIISMNSFNKVIGPQLKVGFVLLHEKTQEKMLATSLNLAGSYCFNSHLVRSFIELGLLDKLVVKQRLLLKSNRDMLYDELIKCKFLEINKAQGGYFLFVRVNEAIDIDKVHQNRQKFELNFIKGTDCGQQELMDMPIYKHLHRFIRLSFSYLSVDGLKEAGKAFVDLIEYCEIKN